MLLLPHPYIVQRAPHLWSRRGGYYIEKQTHQHTGIDLAALLFGKAAKIEQIA
jgi:hypothetical protein